jgi:cell wall-associated NlpC family hydrolase
MPLNEKERENVVRVAKEWYGTPYRGWTCLKGVGCDCGQFLKGVYMEAGHRPDDGIPTPPDYSLQVSQHRKSTEYIDIINKYMREITEAEVLRGDVVVYKLGLAFAHAAIVVSWPDHIIHSLERYGVCAGHGLNFKFGRLDKKFFTVRDEYCAKEEK